jgi:hypothetical protein
MGRQVWSPCHVFVLILCKITRFYSVKKKAPGPPHKHDYKLATWFPDATNLVPYENSTIPSRRPLGILRIHLRTAVPSFWILS